MIKKNDIDDVSDLNTIIFDIDFTLIRYVTFCELLSEHRIVLFPIFDQVITILFEGINRSNYFEAFYNYISRFFPKDRKTRNWLQSIIHRIEKQYVEVIPGVHDTVVQLSRQYGYQIYCLSDFFYDSALDKIKLAGLQQIVRNIFITGNGRKKIDLEAFMDLFGALESYDGTKPSNIIVVGNSIVDVRASLLGCRTILFDFYDEVTPDDMVAKLSSAIVTKFSEIGKILCR